MGRYPDATWRPVARYQPGGSSNAPMAAWRRYGLHTAVSGQRSLYAYFSVPGRATSHFYVAADGYTEQYIDTDYRSTAHLQGNHDTITVETQDMGGPFPVWDPSGTNVPAWTEPQVARLADLGAWLYDEHGVGVVACPDSRPGSRGFCYHRQGIDPWRVTGGELWSKSAGKVCPGNRRVAQVPEIVDRARNITSLPPVTPIPPVRSIDMPIVVVKGRSAHRLITGDRIVGISAEAADLLAKAGVPRTGLPTADVELLERVLVAEISPEEPDEPEVPA